MRVTVRPRLVTVPAQEVLTSEGLSVKISLTATCRTHDPRTWHEVVEDPDAFLYSAMQIGLRDGVAARSLDALTADRTVLGEEVMAATRALVNAAKVCADNPALLQLRMLQAVEAGGATVVLNGSSSPQPG